MTKTFFHIILSCLMTAICFADIPVRYTMIDLGILSSDESEALAINERGQVLGRLKDKGQWHHFLWEKESGLQLIDLPPSDTLFLNNNGQIAGQQVTYVYPDKYSYHAFIWDASKGLYDLGPLDNGETQLLQFNDEGQLLFYAYNYENQQGKTSLWSRGKVLDLSKKFHKQFPEESCRILGQCMNNKGDVIVSAETIFTDPTIYQYRNRLYLWKNEKFQRLFAEYGDTNALFVKSLSDDGSMIANLEHPTQGYATYFINPAKGIQAKFSNYEGELKILNGAPQVISCTPSILKKGLYNSHYYLPGIEIRKILDAPYPFWLSGGIWFRDQNSQGIAVGSCPTIYGCQRHAFVAVPNE